jgi:hypothetical protein
MNTTTKAIIALSAALALAIWIGIAVNLAQKRVMDNRELLHQADLQADSILLANAKWRVRELDSAYKDLQAKHSILINQWANYKYKFHVTDTLDNAALQKLLVNKIEGRE